MLRGIVVVGLLVVAGGAVGHRGFGRSTMHEILDEGTYEDLLDFREKTGRNAMPWIENREDFLAAQEWRSK